MNQNTFAENIAELSNNVSKTMTSLNAMSDAMNADSDVITYTVDDEIITMPSFKNVINRLNTIENTVNAFTSGNGTVKLVDGTSRKIKVQTMPSTPERIINLNKVTTFNINSNWFFEDLMFPKMVVNIDLKNKVDDDSDRIKVIRVIIDIAKNTDYITKIYNESIEGKNLSYAELLKILNSDKSISYFEDEQIINFPLIENAYIGSFNVIKREIEDTKVWYYLDDIYYATNTKNDENELNNILLQKGDKLAFKQSLYIIDDIDINQKKIRLISDIGSDVVGVNSLLTFYNDPFKNKIIEIPVGINEINCIFLKGVNENYNLLGNSWSDMISFITNDLYYESNRNISFKEYYNEYVADFGADWIAQAKEQKISAYAGKIPNTVVLNADNFKVVQINKQINSTMDTDDIKNTQSNIINLKSNIKTLRNTIGLQKMALLDSSNTDNSGYIEQISLNTKKLESAITEYHSNVEFLNAKIKDSKYTSVSPKYRIRGFFPIPEVQYTDSENKIGPQEIIGFDIRYRYLKTDESANDLTSFDYNIGDNIKSNAIFSDWNIISGCYKEKVFNETTGVYEWRSENTADGSEININQIDIPITSGEKVQFCVRSISEAGYPGNPLKSEWSNTIIIEFPEHLAMSNQLSNIIDDVNSEMTAIRLDETLKSAGYYSHIADEIISTENNLTQTYHHDAKNILCNNTNIKDASGNYVTQCDLYSIINVLNKRIEELENTIKKQGMN